MQNQCSLPTHWTTNGKKEVCFQKKNKIANYDRPLQSENKKNCSLTVSHRNFEKHETQLLMSNAVNRLPG